MYTPIAYHYSHLPLTVYDTARLFLPVYSCADKYCLPKAVPEQ